MNVPEKCPKCGAKVEVGYGLMGGGIGPYAFCDNWAGCDWFIKEQDQEGKPEEKPSQ